MASDREILRRSIRQLQSRRKELEARLTTTDSFDQLIEILDQMDLLSIRRAKLEVVHNHLVAGLISIRRPNEEDRRQLQAALETLSVHVEADQRWSAAAKIVRAAIAAAREIRTNLDGRQEPVNAA